MHVMIFGHVMKVVWGCMSDLKQYSDLLLGHVTNPYCYRVTLEGGQLSQFGKLNRGISKAFRVPVRGKLITSSTSCFCPIIWRSWEYMLASMASNFTLTLWRTSTKIQTKFGTFLSK